MMDLVGPTGAPGLSASPSVFVELAMNAAPLLLPYNLIVQVPFNYVVLGNDRGRLAFNSQTGTFKVPLTGTYRIFMDLTYQNLSNLAIANYFVGQILVNNQPVMVLVSPSIGTVGVGGVETVQGSYVLVLTKGDVVTFSAQNGISNVPVYLQGVTAPDVPPFPNTASIQSYF